MIRHSPTLTKLWDDAALRLLIAKQVDYRTGLTVGIYDNLLTCDSMTYRLDLGQDLWLTKQRFTKLQKDYLELHRVELFLDQCKRIADKHARRGVIGQMLCKTHDFKAVGKASQGAHTWGNCMLAFTFHGSPKYKQPTLGLHSRVTYISYLGGLDLALAHVLAKEIAAVIGVEVEDIAFRWHLGALQWHGMKAVPYLFSRDLVERVIDSPQKYPDDRPCVLSSRRCMQTLRDRHEEGKPLLREDGGELYGPIRRIRTRFQHYIEHGESMMPSVPLDTLTFDALRRG